jgi:hypothetical protein
MTRQQAKDDIARMRAEIKHCQDMVRMMRANLKRERNRIERPDEKTTSSVLDKRTHGNRSRSPAPHQRH